MNGKILELFCAAKFDPDRVDSNLYYSLSEEGVKKFAELIIRECGILADQYNFEKHHNTINPIKTTAYEFITNHFGIKQAGLEFR